MVQLYLNPDTDSVYLEVTAGDRSATSMVAVTDDGLILHLDEARVVVAVEVMDVSRLGARVCKGQVVRWTSAVSRRGVPAPSGRSCWSVTGTAARWQELAGA